MRRKIAGRKRRAILKKGGTSSILKIEVNHEMTIVVESNDIIDKDTRFA